MAGSIEKRGENTYRLVVSTGKNLAGTRARKYITFHGTKKEAEAALAEFVTEINHGLVPEGKSITFEEFYYIWKEKYKKGHIPNSSKEFFRCIWDVSPFAFLH